MRSRREQPRHPAGRDGAAADDDDPLAGQSQAQQVRPCYLLAQTSRIMTYAHIMISRHGCLSGHSYSRGFRDFPDRKYPNRRTMTPAAARTRGGAVALRFWLAAGGT